MMHDKKLEPPGFCAVAPEGPLPGAIHSLQPNPGANCFLTPAEQVSLLALHLKLEVRVLALVLPRPVFAVMISVGK
jgi:hypothetical protein